MTRLRLVFMGTPAFAAPTFRALLAAGHEILCTYTQPPRPAGRGRKARPSPIQALAEEAGIEVRTPATLKDTAVQKAFAALAADAAVVVAYGLILPAPVLAAPRLGCVNLHASLLPRWRGAAPIQRAIMAGDGETGVTAMLIDRGLDTGPVLLEERVSIDVEESAGQLHDRLAELGAPLICRALDGLAAGTLTPRPQPEAGVTHAAKIEKAEARLDWHRPAVELARAVRGLAPFPGAWFERGGERVKVLAAAAIGGEGAPGTVLDEGPAVACGEGALALRTLQRAGKAALDGPTFLRGFPLPPGSRLD
ncbi:MAG: methionyl-tRNA formyltransferase [Alphaproteobacteria bacterium]|jgi:methionyl-tRNA formyltransferase|nr:methionyl-tRNA formyltransferase [Alphaproteobacteria bacterium]